MASPKRKAKQANENLSVIARGMGKGERPRGKHAGKAASGGMARAEAAYHNREYEPEYEP